VSTMSFSSTPYTHVGSLTDPESGYHQYWPPYGDGMFGYRFQWGCMGGCRMTIAQKEQYGVVSRYCLSFESPILNYTSCAC